MLVRNLVSDFHLKGHQPCILAVQKLVGFSQVQGLSISLCPKKPVDGCSAALFSKKRSLSGDRGPSPMKVGFADSSHGCYALQCVGRCHHGSR